MSNEELLFFCELIKVEPDRQKKDLLFEEVLNALVEMQSVLGVDELVRCETSSTARMIAHSGVN
jgi:hypothetical protein